VCGIATTPNGIGAIRESKLAIYPNPAVGSFLLETDAVDATVTITDLVGKVVFEKVLAGDKMNISVADFNTGIYIVRIQGKNENASRKLVVGNSTLSTKKSVFHNSVLFNPASSNGVGFFLFNRHHNHNGCTQRISIFIY
jgi:hypothetical protein